MKNSRRITSNTKIKIVLAYLKTGDMTSLKSKYEISKNDIDKWVEIYNKKGSQGFKSYDENGYHKFIKLFSNLFWFSIFLIFISLIIDNNIDKSCLFIQPILKILSSVILNIGIALFVSNIFSFILGTKEFIDLLREKIIGVIVSKEFLSRLSIQDKKDMLSTILRPTKELYSIYSGINDFFSQYIDESLTLFNSQYRSGLQIEGFAYKKDGLVKLDLTLNYRMYKVSGEFEKLSIGFEEEGSQLISTHIFAPDGRTHDFNDLIKLVDRKEVIDPFIGKDSSLIKGQTLEIPIDFTDYNYLDVCRKILEVGHDHWHLFSYKTGHPADKLDIKIRCDSGLSIKKHMIYAKNDNFHSNNEGDKITLKCNSWLKPNFGVAILIGETC